MPCDVSLLSNAKRCAADIAAKHPAIDFLLITAGVVAASRAPTAEGLDQTAVLHYYARWAFIHELLPARREQASQGPVRLLCRARLQRAPPGDLQRPDVRGQPSAALALAAR